MKTNNWRPDRFACVGGVGMRRVKGCKKFSTMRRHPNSTALFYCVDCAATLPTDEQAKLIRNLNRRDLPESFA